MSGTPDDPPGDHMDADAPNPVPAEPAPIGLPRRRRRRRRRPPGEGGPTQAMAAGQNESDAPATSEAQAAPPRDAGPRRRRRRHRGTHRQATAGMDAHAAQTAPDTGPNPGQPEPDGVQQDAPTGSVTGNGEPRGPERPAHLGRRRRRRRPPPAASTAGETAGAQIAAVEGRAAAGKPSTPAVDKEPRGEGQRRSRRRRRPTRSLDATTAGERQVDGASSGQNIRRTPDGARNQASRHRRANDERPGERGRDDRDRSARDRRPRGNGAPGRFDRQRGRGRAAPQTMAQQRLYGLASVVDRGFEDVAEIDEEGGTRRVHWTILKRTVADQQSGKPISATYVLQRDGIDTEYSNLGAARAAANKTIVHPEKLTLSKAEHAAEHAAAKK